jgi:hypothetical protein
MKIQFKISDRARKNTSMFSFVKIIDTRTERIKVNDNRENLYLCMLRRHSGEREVKPKSLLSLILEEG